MPDISMCNNKECKVKENCYRYMAEPDEIQSYCEFKPDKSECEYLMDMRGKD